MVSLAHEASHIDETNFLLFIVLSYVRAESLRNNRLLYLNLFAILTLDICIEGSHIGSYAYIFFIKDPIVGG